MTDASPGPLTYRQGYAPGTMWMTALDRLLAEVFGLDLRPLDAAGGRDPEAVPFSWFDGEGNCVANITAFPLPLTVAGERVEAIGLQSGAVTPAWRGRGLYRDVVEKALSWCADPKPRPVLLYTGEPGLYTRWGFRTLPESRFAGSSPVPHPGPRARRLDPREPGDFASLKALLANRTPVSRHFAVAAHATMFLYHVLAGNGIDLHLTADGATVVASRSRADGGFELLDIVGGPIPDLATLLGALRIEPTRIEASFPPDRLDWTGTPVPSGREDALMIRGSLPGLEGQALMLPPTATF